MSKPPPSSDRRTERLAAELRANLRKRKQRAKALLAGAASAVPTPTEAKSPQAVEKPQDSD